MKKVNEIVLQERIAKALGVPVENIEYTSFVVLMEKLVEVIENGQAD